MNESWEREFYARFTHDMPPDWNYPSTEGAKPKDAILFIRQLLSQQKKIDVKTTIERTKP